MHVDKALLALPCTTLNCEKSQYEAAKSNNAFLTGNLLAEIWSCDQQKEPPASQSRPTAKWVLSSSECGIQRGPQMSGNAVVFRDVLGAALSLATRSYKDGIADQTSAMTTKSVSDRVVGSIGHPPHRCPEASDKTMLGWAPSNDLSSFSTRTIFTSVQSPEGAREGGSTTWTP